jgi:hypothetical protein
VRALSAECEPRSVPVTTPTVTIDTPGVHVIRIGLAIVVVLAATSCSGTGLKTADQVMADITTIVPTAKMGVVYTPDNDPNHLLGRPTLSTRTIRSPVDGSSPAETRTSWQCARRRMLPRRRLTGASDRVATRGS